MKIKSTAQLLGVGLGTALGSLALMSAPAFSATLNFFGADEDAFLQNICDKAGLSDCSDNSVIKDNLKIAKLEGKEGGTGDHLFLSARGSNDKPSDSTDKFSTLLDGGWVNETVYDWTLTWDPTAGNGNGLVTFEAGKEDLRYTYTGQFNTFNALGLLTRADDGFGATMQLTLDEIFFSDGSTPQNSTFVSSSTSDTITDDKNNFNKMFFILDDDSLNSGIYMTELRGTFKMSWDDNINSKFPTNGDGTRANARVKFDITMFDPPGSSSDVTTPEPTAILGLLGVGTLALVGRKRKMEAK